MKTTNKKETAKVEKRSLPLSQSLLLTLKGIISNQACIDNGRAPLGLAIIVFLISAVLLWVPLLSSGYRTDSSSYLATRGNAEVDVGMKAMIETDYVKAFTIDSTNYILDMSNLNSYESVNKDTDAYEKELANTNESALAKGFYVDSQSAEGYGDYEGSLLYIPSDTYVTTPTLRSVEFYVDNFAVLTNSIEDNTTSSTSTSSSVVYEDTIYTTYLRAYYFPTLQINGNTENINLLSNFIYSTILNVTSGRSLNNFPHSFVIITQDYMINYVYALKSSKSNSVIHVYTGNLRDEFRVDSASISSNTTFGSYLFGTDGTITTAFTKFRTLVNEAARAATIHTTWVNIGYLCAVIGGTVIVAAFALLFLHKRKTSVYRDVNFLNTLKEAIFFAFTPCIVGMAFSFFAGFTYECMAVIACTLVRVVFSNNRISPVTQQEDNKPLYQARS